MQQEAEEVAIMKEELKIDEVYEPREDSFLLKEQIKKFAKGTAIDIGTGSGILAAEAAKYCKKVYAVDINKKAVDHCKRLFRDNKKIIVKHSDLFSAVKEKGFDLVLFNAPYLPKEKGISDLALDGGKHGYELLTRLICELPAHLKKKGVALVLFSSRTKKEAIDKAIENKALKARTVATKKLAFFEELYVYAIEKSGFLKSLEEKHNIIPGSLSYLAKGKRGVVYKAKMRKGTRAIDVAIKAKNRKSKAINRIENEIKALKTVNSYSIGPKLIDYGSSKSYFICEFIKGERFEDYLKIATKKEILKIIEDLLLQLYTLDKLGIAKTELSHSNKHIICNKRTKKAVLIDFERAKIREKPRNLTQFCQYIIKLSSKSLLKANIDKKELLKLASDYHKKRDKIAVNKILNYIRKFY